MELISVIVPVYNKEMYLRKCLDSILAQTYRNLEIILVDDGSTDASGGICDEYGERDSRIHVMHKPNGGAADARNAGIEMAGGRFLGFVDGDDYIAPAMYERLYSCIREDETDMAICMPHFIDAYGNEICMDQVYPDGHSVMTGREAAEFLGSQGSVWFGTLWNKLYKAELFAGLRFPVSKICEDDFIAHRVLWACHAISYLPERLYYYVRHGGDIMVTERYSPRRLDGVEAMLDRVSFGLAKKDWHLVCVPYKTALELLAAVRSHLDGNSAEGMERYHQLKAAAKKYSMKIIFGKCDFRTKKAAALLLLFNINLYEFTHDPAIHTI